MTLLAVPEAARDDRDGSASLPSGSPRWIPHHVHGFRFLLVLDPWPYYLPPPPDVLRSRILDPNFALFSLRFMPLVSMKGCRPISPPAMSIAWPLFTPSRLS